MSTLSALLFENGLPNLPVLLIEPHRNPGGIWRIKFSYEASEALSMSAVQASTMASSLQEMGEVELADEIDGALKSAARYASM
jgi:esterase/lipase superfamily enzyme